MAKYNPLFYNVFFLIQVTPITISSQKNKCIILMFREDQQYNWFSIQLVKSFELTYSTGIKYYGQYIGRVILSWN